MGGFIPVAVYFNVFFLESTGPLFGPVLVAQSVLVDGKSGSAVWQGPRGTPHGDVRPPAEEGLEVWTGVDFSVCVVAPPGERSVGAGRWEAVRRESG